MPATRTADRGQPTVVVLLLWLLALVAGAGLIASFGPEMAEDLLSPAIGPGVAEAIVTAAGSIPKPVYFGLIAVGWAASWVNVEGLEVILPTW